MKRKRLLTLLLVFILMFTYIMPVNAQTTKQESQVSREVIREFLVNYNKLGRVRYYESMDKEALEEEYPQVKATRDVYNTMTKAEKELPLVALYANYLSQIENIMSKNDIPADKVAPVITVDTTPIKINVGEELTVPEATATDDVDGTVEVTNNASEIDTSVAGEYTITYTARDTAGNTAIETVQVTIVEGLEEEGLVSGKYVLVDTNNQVPVVLEGGWVTRSDASTDPASMTDAAMTLEISGDQVKIKDGNGVYLAPKGGNNNGIRAGEYEWLLVDNGDGTYSFKGQGSDTVTFANNRSASGYRAYKNSTISGRENSYPYKFTLHKVDFTENNQEQPQPVDPQPQPDPSQNDIDPGQIQPEPEQKYNPLIDENTVSPLIDSSLNIEIEPNDIELSNKGKLTIHNQKEGDNIAAILPNGKLMQKNVPYHGRWSPLQTSIKLYPGDQLQIFKYKGNVRGPATTITVPGEGPTRPESESRTKYGRQHFSYVPTIRDSHISYMTEPFFTVELTSLDGSKYYEVATYLGQTHFYGLELKSGDVYSVRVFDRQGNIVKLDDSNLFNNPSRNQTSTTVK